jgi:hypothetical protein
MADRRNHESEDLSDYEVLDGSDTLDDSPVDDPLDQGVAAPVRWSAGMRYALKGEEDDESLDELLDEEEPDDTAEALGEAWDENATEEDVARFEESDEPDPRAGRLTATDEDADPATGDEFTAHDAGIGGGAATAEEAAIHVEDEE